MLFLDQKKETSSKKGSKVDYEKIGEAANHFRKWLNNQENDPINSDAIRELQYILDCQRVNQNQGMKKKPSKKIKAEIENQRMVDDYEKEQNKAKNTRTIKRLQNQNKQLKYFMIPGLKQNDQLTKDQR